MPPLPLSRSAARAWALLPLALVAACATTLPPPSSLERALTTLRQRPAWLFEADRCPADVAPATEQEVRGEDDPCVTDLSACLRRCEARDPAACYAAALRVQQLRSDEPASEALFLRSCRLGVMSGCTNRAAGITKDGYDNEDANRCATRTFELTCHANDPWGCTMFGFHLMKGIGTARDPEKALQVLRGSCRYGPEDPACARANELIEELEKARRGSRT